MGLERKKERKKEIMATGITQVIEAVAALTDTTRAGPVNPAAILG
jgi:hypothetical protein